MDAMIPVLKGLAFFAAWSFIIMVVALISSTKNIGVARGKGRPLPRLKPGDILVYVSEPKKEDLGDG